MLMQMRQIKCSAMKSVCTGQVFEEKFRTNKWRVSDTKTVYGNEIPTGSGLHLKLTKACLKNSTGIHNKFA